MSSQNVKLYEHHFRGFVGRSTPDSRTFPVFIYDPRNCSPFRERLSLPGNPNVKEDWYVNPKTGEQIDFVYFARREGRFAKHFDKGRQALGDAAGLAAGAPRKLAAVAGSSRY